MTAHLTKRRLAGACALVLLFALYLTGLSRMGLVSADEPRYADIGRAMAKTGDWITPRLFGQAWFEKPPLLYWLEVTGFKAGLGPELAPRLPVAVLSVVFLIFFHVKVRRLWDKRTADLSTAMLATCGGWLAFSHVAVTDIPVAVMFSIALFSFLERRVNGAAAALGFAVLAKSLVPLVLFAPVLALDYRRWREWIRPAPLAVFFAVALPWHVLCAIRNGGEFVRILFLQQQFGRFFSPERQHVQHWWFYVPVVLLLLFPWFPLLPFAARAPRDHKGRVLLAVVVVGFIFFSASLNKLPGYLLPLMPALCVLMGAGAARAKNLRAASAAAAALVGTLPLIAAFLPEAVAESLPRALQDYRPQSWALLLVPVASGGVVFVMKRRAFPASACAAAAGLLWFSFTVLPPLDKTSSARAEWLRDAPGCTPRGTERRTVYGLSYYAGHALPECAAVDPKASSGVR